MKKRNQLAEYVILTFGDLSGEPGEANFSEDQLKQQAQYQLIEDYLIGCIE